MNYFKSCSSCYRRRSQELCALRSQDSKAVPTDQDGNPGCFQGIVERMPLHDVFLAQARSRLRQGVDPFEVEQWLCDQHLEYLEDEIGRMKFESGGSRPTGHIGGDDAFCAGGGAPLTVSNLARSAAAAQVKLLELCSQPDDIPCATCRSKSCVRKEIATRGAAPVQTYMEGV